MSFEIKRNGNLIRLMGMESNILRVTYTKKNEFHGESPIGITASENVSLRVKEEDKYVIADAGRIKVKVNPENL
ncbi:MAG: hypothetical protein K6F66_07250, partial [Pseudobutyrivibrio sp.]|nr:hypothetical protein [Pseudobutyrivibrio sp.]